MRGVPDSLIHTYTQTNPHTIHHNTVQLVLFVTQSYVNIQWYVPDMGDGKKMSLPCMKGGGWEARVSLTYSRTDSTEAVFFLDVPTSGRSPREPWRGRTGRYPDLHVAHKVPNPGFPGTLFRLTSQTEPESSISAPPHHSWKTVNRGGKPYWHMYQNTISAITSVSVYLRYTHTRTSHLYLARYGIPRRHY